MLRTSESETEILLGNKQLLGIFFVVVILLGVAFAGGYKLGQASKKASSTQPSDQTVASEATGTGGETHSVPAASTGANTDNSSSPAETTSAHVPQAPSGEDEPPLGSPKRAKAAKTRQMQREPIAPESAATTSGFAPQTGQLFLQVAAVGRDEAEAVADVLHKKGFRAHAVPKPGNAKVFRVLIGPIRDAGDLSSTRDLLRKTGFREVIVQRY